jgi:hypothetical protein
MERIKEAAILHEGKVYTGRRHCNIIHAIVQQTGCKRVPATSPQGFVTEEGRFVDREEGAKIALACGQIKKLKYNSRDLFSEDLY